MKLAIHSTFLWLALGVPVTSGAAVPVPPRPDRYATDLAGVVDAGRLAALNERLAQFERETSNQVLVYVDKRVPAGTTLEEFANAAFNAWGVGQKGKDNGVVLFVFTEDRKVRFEVGYGLEGPIPDARTVRIREDYLVPRFRANDYAGGIEQTVDQLMKAARGEAYQGTGKTVAEAPPSGPSGPMAWWVFLIPLVGGYVGYRVGRGADDSMSKMIRGGGTFVFVTGFLSMFAAPVTGDARPVAIGFGMVMLGFAGFVAWMIGRDTKLTGRRRVGLGLVQTGATLVVFGFALLCFGAIWASLIGRGGWSILWGILALIVGGFVCAKEPVRALTVVVARLAFFVLLVSAIVLVVIRLQEGRISMAVLDWVVVTGFVWIALLVFARSRGWRIAPEADVRSATFSGGGRSSGWSSGWSSIGSSSGSSSWSSSSSSSGSSYSGGGGRSGGGGSSGSW